MYLLTDCVRVATILFTLMFLNELESVIRDRITTPSSGSYVNSLVASGLDRVLKKIGEEAGEVIIAAKNQSPDELRYEAADLVFHLSIVLQMAGLSWQDIDDELRRRHS
ncbi:phosphoribosyl-ATP diphosphatase [bacterium]|nr:phosphoribosyl-ATP diphosphatase [bacterium]